MSFCEDKSYHTYIKRQFASHVPSIKYIYIYPAVMAQWLGCRTRNHKFASSSPATPMSSLGIGSLNHKLST